MSIFYIFLALWVSAGIVQTYVTLRLLTTVGAEVLVKSWNYSDRPDLNDKFKEYRAEGGLERFSRKQCYYAFILIFGVWGVLLGAISAVKHKFQPHPKWVQLMKEVNRYNPVNRF